jgi:hypothetical protein
MHASRVLRFGLAQLITLKTIAASLTTAIAAKILLFYPRGVRPKSSAASGLVIPSANLPPPLNVLVASKARLSLSLDRELSS